MEVTLDMGITSSQLITSSCSSDRFPSCFLAVSKPLFWCWVLFRFAISIALLMCTISINIY
ncbi:hypothetical protein Lal_00012424 [Lupinus albus]|nr:hypothetical protein Lal_00012424 [Lupinus albus]